MAKNQMKAFREAVNAARGKTARSSLYRWLRSNHNQFLQAWREGADWPAFVQAFTALGLTDRTGKPPVPETVRKTWLQVRKDIAKAKERRPGGASPRRIPSLAAPRRAIPAISTSRPPTHKRASHGLHD